ncbi:Rieske (2Fe-2S) protein [Desulfonema magnum]|uniref:Rieske [2Fe-2S] domain-containing protein n=1 Tax=Desulfonema magnum TaxID=45655 RepID=A0A975BR34_9BACT|nr:Rieske (2Fe-2S) protein [Desulfonema magnum]QTA90136.1 Rieske [2Fe-2S] domain-containing protein [Desulfonema magnum]
MGLLSRIFGICKTKPPGDPGCWTCSHGKLEIDLARVPEFSESGKAIRLEGKGLSERILVVYGNDGQIHAVENRCTHMGRRLDPLAGDEAVQCCSVSKSTFSYAGTVISGAAKTPLKTFNVEMKDGKAIILLN